ncbi:hypothetical protein ABRE13_002213 [Salmonella enterica]|nr:hypothetical protein [Salmonella enterica]EEG9243087.1 hypothetical protein [Salmonella enterica]EFU8578926.1 hypothetical protein [Salmonella enterica]EGJ3920868.1 hypothetical protein [Salmonella enterica]EGP1727541.1 hypothetical protein [Salmonella enterica]
MGFYNGGPDVSGYRHHLRCRAAFSVSFDTSDGVVLHGFLPLFFPHIERGRQPHGYEAICFWGQDVHF